MLQQQPQFGVGHRGYTAIAEQHPDRRSLSPEEWRRCESAASAAIPSCLQLGGVVVVARHSSMSTIGVSLQSTQMGTWWYDRSRRCRTWSASSGAWVSWREARASCRSGRRAKGSCRSNLPPPPSSSDESTLQVSSVLLLVTAKAPFCECICSTASTRRSVRRARSVRSAPARGRRNRW